MMDAKRWFVAMLLGSLLVNIPSMLVLRQGLKDKTEWDSRQEQKENRLLITKMEVPVPDADIQAEHAIVESMFPSPEAPAEPEIVTARPSRYAQWQEVEGKATMTDFEWSLDKYTIEIVPGKKTPVLIYKQAPYQYYGASPVLLSDVDQTTWRVGQFRVLVIDRDRGIGIVETTRFMRDHGVEVDKPGAAEMLKHCGLDCTPADMFWLVQHYWGR